MFQPEPEPDPSEDAPSEVESARSPESAPADPPESVPADLPESPQPDPFEDVLPPVPEEPAAPAHADVPLPVEVPKWAPQDVFSGPSEPASSEAPAPAPDDVVSGADESAESAAEPVSEPVSEAPAPPADDDAPPVESLLPAPLDLSPPAPEPVAEPEVPAVTEAADVPSVPEQVADVPAPEPVAEVSPVPEAPAVPEPVAEAPEAPAVPDQVVEAPEVPEVPEPAAPEPVAEAPEVPEPAAPEPVAEVPAAAPEPEVAPAAEVPGPFPFTPAPAAEPVPAEPVPAPEAVTESLPPVPPPPVPTAAAESLPPVPPPVPDAPAEPVLDPMFRSASSTAAPGVEDAAAAAAVAAPFGAPAAPAAEEASPVADVPEHEDPDTPADVSSDYASAGFDEPGLAPVIPIDMDGKWVAGKGRGARSSGQERPKRSRGLALKRSKEENPFEVVGDPAAEAAAPAPAPADVSPAPAPEGKRGFGREIRFGRKKKEAAPTEAPAGWESAPGAVPQAAPAQPSEGDAMWGAAPAAAAVWGAPPAAAAPAAPAGIPAAVPAPPTDVPAGAVPPPPPGTTVPQTLPPAPGFGDSTDAPFPTPEFTPTPPKRGFQLPSFFTKRSGGGGSRKTIAIIVVAVLVAAGLGYMFLGRGGGATTPAFALDLSAGQTYTYRMNVAIDAHVYAGGRSIPVNEAMGATMKWDVQSVDAQGNATVAVDLSDFTVNMNGQTVPTGSIPSDATHFTMRVAPDGSILQGGALGMFGGSNASTAGGVPGTDQFTPVLPGHDVAVGASWTKTYNQTLPYGMGTIHAKTHSTYLRTESVDGANAAVIVSKTTIPLHMKIDLRQMLQQLGSSSSGSLPAGANPVMTYKGKVKAQTTGWFDPNARQVLKTSMTAQFDMHIAISGVPGGMPGGLDHMVMKGAMTMTMQKA